MSNLLDYRVIDSTDVVISDDSFKLEFYQIMNSIGLYNDIARVIYSYKFGYDKYININVPFNLAFSNLRQFIDNILYSCESRYADEMAFYIIDTINNNLIELANEARLSIDYNRYLKHFKYNGQIFIQTKDSVYLFEVNLDKYKLTPSAMFDRLNQIRHTNQIGNCLYYIEYCGWGRTRSQTYYYVLYTLILGTDNEFSKKECILINGRNTQIDDYLLDNWSCVIFALFDNHKYIYYFHKDGEFYKYCCNERLTDRHALQYSNLNVNNRLLVSKIKSNRRIKPYSCKYISNYAIKLPYQDNQIILPKTSELMEIKYCSLLTNNIVYLQYKSEAGICHFKLLKLV